MTTVTGQITASSGQFAALAVEMAHALPGDIQAAIRRNSNKSAFWALQNAHELLQEMRPGDRSPTDRYYAVAITDMEKVLAYFQTYVLDSYVKHELPHQHPAYTVPAGENGAPLCPYCAEELIWTRIETHDKSGWIKGWLCGCQFEDAVTEAVS